MIVKNSALLTTAIALFAQAAHADVSISNKPTQNMSCDAGVCTATAPKAVLNVGELQSMLASGDVTVKTGTVAKDIEIAQPLTWSNISRLTLDAQRSVVVRKQITVSGQGALTVTTNTGAGKKTKTASSLSFPEHGSVQFLDLGSSLIIDGDSYTLVADIKTLAADIAANPAGFYALAKPYDASADGTYIGSPVATTFTGTFEGMGNFILNLKLTFSNDPYASLGLFSELDGGTIRNFGVKDFDLQSYDVSGAIVGTTWSSHIENCYAFGHARGGNNQVLGGLVGAANIDVISDSWARVDFEIEGAYFGAVGGLLGAGSGTVRGSYAMGRIRSTGEQYNARIGGLVGGNIGVIKDSFALTTVHAGHGCCDGQDSFGGLVGVNWQGATVFRSYAAGKTSIHQQYRGAYAGGFVGSDEATPGSLVSAYWNLDKGVSDPADGAGNVANDPGITGLTDEQLKAGLPEGFDSKVWGQKKGINNGYPYLLANPPQ